MLQEQPVRPSRSLAELTHVELIPIEHRTASILMLLTAKPSKDTRTLLKPVRGPTGALKTGSRLQATSLKGIKVDPEASDLTLTTPRRPFGQLTSRNMLSSVSG